ncbi:unnamed protein product, partial [Laminaria digitata]
IGFGVSVDLARSCLALSVARQRDLWSTLRNLSSNDKVARVVYVAGELDCRYGRSTRPLRLSTPTPAAVEAVPSSEERSPGARGLGDSGGPGTLTKGVVAARERGGAPAAPPLPRAVAEVIE